jgi:hypothetical protein
MENGTILRSQVTASSTANYKSSPPLARLNLQETPTHEGGWFAGGEDLHPWLQVDFLEYAKVTAVITQGRQMSTANFVHEFTVSYGNNNEDFQQYAEFGIVKVNKKICLSPPSVMYFIRRKCSRVRYIIISRQHDASRKII